MPALLADEQWDALGKRLRGIEQSMQVMFSVLSLHVFLIRLHATSFITCIHELPSAVEHILLQNAKFGITDTVLRTRNSPRICWREVVAKMSL